MKLRYKVPLVVVGVVVLAIGAGLLTVGTIGPSRGVSRVPVPSGSMIGKPAIDADYADSYVATVPGTLFPNTRALDRFAFQRSTVAGETPDEIMYKGESSGLVYHISYLRRRESAETKLYVSTTVHYREPAGVALLCGCAPWASGARPVYGQRDDSANRGRCEMNFVAGGRTTG